MGKEFFLFFDVPAPPGPIQEVFRPLEGFDGLPRSPGQAQPKPEETCGLPPLERWAEAG